MLATFLLVIASVIASVWDNFCRQWLFFTCQTLGNLRQHD